MADLLAVVAFSRESTSSCTVSVTVTKTPSTVSVSVWRLVVVALLRATIDCLVANLATIVAFSLELTVRRKGRFFNIVVAWLLAMIG